MKTALAFAAACLLVLLPGAARGAACTPLDCAPSQLTLAHGTLLAFRNGTQSPLRVIDLRSGKTRWRLPAGVVGGHVLVAKTGALLTWYDVATGARLHDAVLQLHGAFDLVGASQSGSTAVLARTQTRSTTFALVSPHASRVVRLGGQTWGFDALRGDHLVLIRYHQAGGYEIRLYDLATNTLASKPLKDPRDSALIWGMPFARVSSADGRYLATLYVTQNGAAMVHVLDLARAAARCVDLPGTGNFDAVMTTGLAIRGDTLWVVSAGYGRVTAIDVATRTVRAAFRFDAGIWTGSSGAAALSPDGRHLAFADGQHVWFADLAKRKVTGGGMRVVLGLGFSPGAGRLWVVGERSRVSPLLVR